VTGKAGLKAGVIGAGVVVVLTGLGQIPFPFVSCVCCLSALLAYAGAGALAGYFLDPPRTAGSGAGAGAIAGTISGIGGTLVYSIASALGGAGALGDYTSFLDPEMVQQLADAGIDPQSFATASGVGGIAVIVGLCCITMLVLGALLGAMGGALYCSTNPE